MGQRLQAGPLRLLVVRLVTPELRRVHVGRSEEVLSRWDENSVDAVVCDPPYGLGKEPDPRALMRDWLEKGFHEVKGAGFMGKEWDAFVPQPAFWAEVFRIMKPGAHLLAFSGTRTYDWMVLGIRMAGYEIRDQVAWVYGSGFPKSMDISKAIDKAAGAKRPVLGKRSDGVGNTARSLHKSEGFATSRSKEFAVTSAASAAWEGWGTALKPAIEPVVLARKPISEKTIAANVLRWGTGALNIEATRIGFASADDEAESKEKNRHADFGTEPGGNAVYGDFSMVPRQNYDPSGRWPSNVLLDQYAAGVLDGKESDASRFFYVAKPDGAERNAGLESERVVTAAEVTGRKEGSAGLKSPRAGKTSDAANFHPTVKPVDLMAYLIKLVTPRGGVVLDPFLGSGTTAIAAERLGHPWIGIELSPEYAALAEKRIAAETEQGRLF